MISGHRLVTMPVTDGASTVADDGASTVDVPLQDQARVRGRGVLRTVRGALLHFLQPFGCFEGLQGEQWTAEDQGWATVAETGNPPHLPYLAPIVEESAVQPRSDLPDRTAVLSGPGEERASGSAQAPVQDQPTSLVAANAATGSLQSPSAAQLVFDEETNTLRAASLEERISSLVAAKLREHLANLRQQPSAGGTGQEGGAQTHVVKK